MQMCTLVKYDIGNLEISYVSGMVQCDYQALMQTYTCCTARDINA